MDEKTILTKLKQYRNKDLKYEDGVILGSMCSKPHNISKKIMEMFYETNLGDPGLFSGTKQLEDEVIHLLGDLLNNKPNNSFGYIISGGTEGNITAMRVIKNIFRKNNKNNKNNNSNNSNNKPTILIPETAHFSFDKAKEIMDLNVVSVPLTKQYTINTKFVKEYIEDSQNKTPVNGIVGIAGSTELGTIDNIGELNKIANENNIYIHVDSAFGGFVIPFLEDKYKIENYNYKYDFSLNCVNSITIDPHKMGLSPIPAGGILFRNNSFKKYLDVDAPYLTDIHQATLIGTRSGIGVATTWGIMNLLGEEGYRQIVNNCMETTYYLVRKSKELGFKPVINPVLNIVALEDEHPDETSLKLREKGWFVSVCKCVKALRLVIMPHVKKEHIDKFLIELCSVKRK